MPELSFHGIHTSCLPEQTKSVTHVSGTKCHLCLGPFTKGNQWLRTVLRGFASPTPARKRGKQGGSSRKRKVAGSRPPPTWVASRNHGFPPARQVAMGTATLHHQGLRWAAPYFPGPPQLCFLGYFPGSHRETDTKFIVQPSRPQGASTTRSARGYHPCHRNNLSPRCPGWTLISLARPERFELPTPRFVV
jgi:hypothetical protein